MIMSGDGGNSNNKDHQPVVVVRSRRKRSTQHHEGIDVNNGAEDSLDDLITPSTRYTHQL